MTLQEYESRAMETCMPTCNNPLYMIGLLHEEAGELQGKINKAIRKGWLEFEGNQIAWLGTQEQLEEFHADCQKELGDVCWAVAGIAHIFKFGLRGTAQTNLDKLADRRNRGVIIGEGDNR